MGSKISPPEGLKLLGKGQLLPHLRTTISQASQSIWIVGPWLDAYFVGNIIDSISYLEIEVRFIVRIDDDGIIDSKTLSALNLARKNIPNYHARSLLNLHSKVILIDKEIFYLGSTNWYWYSLHKSQEITVTGKTGLLPEIIKELDDYWDKAIPLTTADVKGYHDLEPLTEDISREIIEKRGCFKELGPLKKKKDFEDV